MVKLIPLAPVPPVLKRDRAIRKPTRRPKAEQACRKVIPARHKELRLPIAPGKTPISTKAWLNSGVPKADGTENNQAHKSNGLKG